MAQNRYIKDYRLLETVNERGRIRTELEYIGDDYYFVRGLAAVRKDRKLVFPVCAAAWAALIGGLLPNSAGMHTLYVSLPYLFTLLALGLLTETILTALPAKEPFEHRQADRLTNQWPPAALAAGILPCVSLLGELIRLLIGLPMNAGDGLLCLCAAIAAGCAFFLFSRRKRFAVRKG